MKGRLNIGPSLPGSKSCDINSFTVSLCEDHVSRFPHRLHVVCQCDLVTWPSFASDTRWGSLSPPHLLIVLSRLIFQVRIREGILTVLNGQIWHTRRKSTHGCLGQRSATCVIWCFCLLTECGISGFAVEVAIWARAAAILDQDPSTPSSQSQGSLSRLRLERCRFGRAPTTIKVKTP